MEKLQIKKILSIISLLFIPTMVFAIGEDSALPLWIALAMEAFVSLHMSLIVLKPLSYIISKENSKKIFWILFAIRALILILFDLFISKKGSVPDMNPLCISSVSTSSLLFSQVDNYRCLIADRTKTNG